MMWRHLRAYVFFYNQIAAYHLKLAKIDFLYAQIRAEKALAEVERLRDQISRLETTPLDPKELVKIDE